MKLLQELNWLFAKYKRLENESTVGADASVKDMKLLDLASLAT